MAPVEDIADDALRTALEFAVDVLAAGLRRRPALPVPAALRPFLRVRRLPDRALAVVRAALETEPEVLARVAGAATPDRVDELGLLWLRRPPGWQDRVAATTRAGPHPNVAAATRGDAERRRRIAAESAAERAGRELQNAQRLLAEERVARRRLDDGLRAALARLDAASRTASEQERARLAADARLAAGQEALRAAQHAAADATARLDEALAVRDAVLADRATGLTSGTGPTVARLQLREGIEHLPEPRRPTRVTRQPVALPGGVYGDSLAAAEFLLREAGALVLVDGYNVAKLGWPALTLEQQREQCIAAAEDVARRWATLVTVVFDGADADVDGASTSSRRLVHVTFSPSGVLADDMLRAFVDAADEQRAVVVVTNDRAVAGDVRRRGANVLASEQFLAAARR